LTAKNAKKFRKGREEKLAQGSLLDLERYEAGCGGSLD
jgi:hypothetical protein